jgi:tetrahydromethanopterin S-methyltransferase subunit G
MSVIEDARKVMQDLIAPELRALSVRLDAVDKQLEVIDKRFDGVDKKFDDVDRRAEKRHQELMHHMDQRIDDLGFLLRKSDGSQRDC